MGHKRDRLFKGRDIKTERIGNREKLVSFSIKNKTMDYKEHEKLSKIAEKSQAAGEVLEFIKGQGYIIGTYYDGEIVPTYLSINDILSKMYDIDLVKIEEEKRHMLEEIRKNN